MEEERLSVVMNLRMSRKEPRMVVMMMMVMTMTMRIWKSMGDDDDDIFPSTFKMFT